LSIRILTPYQILLPIGEGGGGWGLICLDKIFIFNNDEATKSEANHDRFEGKCVHISAFNQILLMLGCCYFALCSYINLNRYPAAFLNITETDDHIFFSFSNMFIYTLYIR
jgi:hypothetical protein